MALHDRIKSLAEAVGADMKSVQTSVANLTGQVEALSGQGPASGKLSPLLIYYGFPIAYKGLWVRNAVISEIAANFTHWVVGHTYQEPTHESYADTVAIVQGVRALGVKVYGYIPLGVSSYNYTQNQMRTHTDQWAAIGVDGIFLDEFGFDYGNTRARQKAIVDYVHSKSLVVVANAWTVYDFSADNISELPFPSNDWRYTNYATGNPANIALTRLPTDVYLVENFCFDNTAPGNMFDVQERCEMVRSVATAKNFVVWALAVFGESTPGVLDSSLLGNSGTLENAGAYISANAFLYDFKVCGSGGFSFGSGGTPIWAPLYDLPAGAGEPTGIASGNYTTGVFTRTFGSVKITVNNLTAQTVYVTGDEKRNLSGSYPVLYQEVYVSPTAPTTPFLNQIWIDTSQ